MPNPSLYPANRRPLLHARAVRAGTGHSAAREFLRRRLTAEKAQDILLHIAGLPIDTDRHAMPRGKLLALTVRFRLSG